ncbi:Wzz/FepE/Etk N-terminal domain-containing protein [Salinispirillum marinum]|uniref:Wzz/FepE/Etk N-terminal domain-containing protein n=2 Tax=Saccharospirillaceae TaxID=255527 RepID=A0ABV8BEB4_9GAMM
MHNTHDTDEIDLRHLVLIILQGWRWWVGSTVLAIVLAFGWLLTQKPSYTAEFSSLPVVSQQYQLLNSIPGMRLDPEQVMQDLKNRLSSTQHFVAIVGDHPDIFSLPENTTAQEYFNAQWQVSNTSDSNELSVAYTYGEDEEGAVAVNQYVALTAEGLWQQYIERLNTQNVASIQGLEEQLQLLQATLRVRRDERVQTLIQAIEIAQELGIETPTTPQDYGRQRTGNEVLYANVGTENNSLPLYFLGYRALDAERQSILENFDEGLLNSDIIATEEQLRQLQQLQQHLEANTFDARTGMAGLPHTERLVTVLEYAAQPVRPNESNKALILVASTLLGGFFGLMLALLARFARSVREYAEQQ